MIKYLVRWLTATLLGSIVLALAGLLGTIAASFAVYAVAAALLSPSAAAALTAVVFAIVVAGIAATMPMLMGLGPQVTASPTKARADSQAMTSALETGMAAAGLVADAMLERRLKKADKRRGKGADKSRRR